MDNIEITQEMLSELIAKKSVRKIRAIFDEHNIVDLADIVSKLALDEAMFIFRVLKKGISGELFAYLDSEVQESLISSFAGDEISSMVDNLYSDDILEILEEMPAEIVKKVLSSISSERREEINKLLSYESNSAGSIMTTDFMELAESDSVEVAMKKIKLKGRLAETINYCFILNAHGVLTGIVSLREIIFAPTDTIIGDLMTTDFVYVCTKDDQEEAIKQIQKYDIALIPVVDDSNRLVGVITADDIIDAIEVEATEDIHKMAGVAPIEGSYMKTGIVEMSKSRLTWLLVLMITYTISSLIIDKNSDLLVTVPSLLAFMPMLMDTAGNAGSQASAMVIRGITVNDLEVKDFFKVILKEMSVALICGFILFALNTLRIVFLVDGVGWDIAITVSLSVFVVVVVAKMVGGILPLIALVVKQDPAAMASPLITTCVDSLSLIVYFGLARIILRI
ncbi:MAG: magnesium transporter [Erysipelotrichales bacterium]|nr:magnesium transporter [Erysipelotrichales bacterium]